MRIIVFFLLLILPVQVFAQQSSSQVSPQGKSIDPMNRPMAERGVTGYNTTLYWIGYGQGDMSKGKVVCERVAELSARADLAKQIRVMVKEHMIDRVHEGSGQEAKQDIEVTREEIVQEYLRGVLIVDRHTDEGNNLCIATAVMRKTPE